MKNRAVVGLNATNLKNVLWQTLNSVSKKKINAHDANAIASQSREIMRIIRAEIEIAKLGGLGSFSGFSNQAQLTQKAKETKKLKHK